MTQTIIRLRKITKEYPTRTGPFKALAGIDLDVRKGDFLAIMGPSGSGKTTLANILGLLDSPTDGTFDFVGSEIAKADDQALTELRSRSVGFIFQDYALIDHFNALENVMLALHYDPTPRRLVLARAKEKLQMLGLGEKMLHFPKQLSGGQKQRVAIARALLKEPQLLLADEPAGALDPRSRIEVLSILQRLNSQGVTIIMVTHSEEDATAANRLIRIEEGRIIEDSIMLRRNRFFSAMSQEQQTGVVEELISQFAIEIGPGTRQRFLDILTSGAGFETIVVTLRKADPAWLSDPEVLKKYLEIAASSSGYAQAVLTGFLMKAWSLLTDREQAHAFLHGLDLASWTDEAVGVLAREFPRTPTTELMQWLNPACLAAHPSARVRAMACGFFRYILHWDRPQDSAAIQALLKDNDPRVRANAVELFVLAGPHQRLLSELDFAADPTPRVRAAWCKVLMRTGRMDAALDIVMSMFLSEQEAEIKAAAFVLASETTVDLVELMRRIVRENPDRTFMLTHVSRAVQRAREFRARAQAAQEKKEGARP